MIEQIFEQYYDEEFVKAGRKETNNVGNLPYFSNSSMSVVTAGIVALLKEINNNLSPQQIKEILVETSRNITYDGYKVNRVVDAVEAATAQIPCFALRLLGLGCFPGPRAPRVFWAGIEAKVRPMARGISEPVATA